MKRNESSRGHKAEDEEAIELIQRHDRHAPVSAIFHRTSIILDNGTPCTRFESPQSSVLHQRIGKAIARRTTLVSLLAARNFSELSETRRRTAF